MASRLCSVTLLQRAGPADLPGHAVGIVLLAFCLPPPSRSRAASRPSWFCAVGVLNPLKTLGARTFLGAPPALAAAVVGRDTLPACTEERTPASGALAIGARRLRGSFPYGAVRLREGNARAGPPEMSPGVLRCPVCVPCWSPGTFGAPQLAGVPSGLCGGGGGVRQKVPRGDGSDGSA